MHAVTGTDDPIGALAERLAIALAHTEAQIGPRPMGVAVSGGADSLALALAARRLHPGVPLGIVDHGLRPESAAEAVRVAQFFSPPAEILSANGISLVRAGLEERARRARYDALARWARMRGVSLVLTGHHADDAVETLAMRLRRRPGLLGLAGLRSLVPFPNWPEGAGLFLGRPFLVPPFLGHLFPGLRRAHLQALLRAGGHEWVEDPMNADPVFERARVRACWANVDEAADARRFARLFGLYQRLCARRARAAAAARLALATAVFDDEAAAAIVPGAVFFGLSSPAQSLFAQALVAAIADRSLLPAAGAARRRFLLALAGEPVASFHMTLVSARSGQIRVMRAPPRRGALDHRPMPPHAAAMRAFDLLVS